LPLFEERHAVSEDFQHNAFLTSFEILKHISAKNETRNGGFYNF